MDGGPGDLLRPDDRIPPGDRPGSAHVSGSTRRIPRASSSRRSSGGFSRRAKIYDRPSDSSGPSRPSIPVTRRSRDWTLSFGGQASSTPCCDSSPGAPRPGRWSWSGRSHWADQGTEEFVARLADGLVAHRILMIVTSRPGYSPPASHRTVHTRLALTGLSPAHSVAMARALMSVNELPARLQALLGRRVEGNPFFLEEAAARVPRNGRDPADGRRAAGVADLDALDLPATVQDVILARIGRLGPASRRVLEVASVVGREFPQRVLDRFADPPGRPRTGFASWPRRSRFTNNICSRK